MNRKRLLLTVLATLAVAVVFMGYTVVDTVAEQWNLKARIESIPSRATLFDLDSARVVFPAAKPVAVIIFNSTCQHCQYELAQIKAAINSFNNIELVFLSSEPILAIKKVALLFESHRNVNFIKINPEDVYDNFGTVRYPTILIYGTNGKLIKEFKGETKVEAILRYARQ